MKRKIIFVVIVMALLACLFTITSYAAEIPEWTEITVVEGMPDKSTFGADGTTGATSRVLMSDGVTYPAYYICKNSESLGLSYTDLNTKASKSYTAADVVRLEVPVGTVKTPLAVLKTENGYTALKTVSFPEGFTTMGSYTFKATDSIPSALVSVSLPSTLTTMGQAEFIRCANLEELVIPEGVTSIPKEFAYYATGLKTLVLPSTIETINESAFRSADLSDGIVIPEGCTTIGKYAFKGSNAPSVVVPSTVESISDEAFALSNSLTYVYCKCPTITYRMFYTCPNIETVILENTITIESHAFNNPNGGTTNISKLVLPEGLTSIGTYAFTRTALTELVLPSTLETIGEGVFITSKSLKKVVVLGSTLGKTMFDGCSAMDELVLTEKITTFESGCLNSVSSTFTTYYTGTDYSTVQSSGGAASTRIKNAGYCSYDDYITGNYTAKDCMFIYDANLCEVAFDGSHAEDNNPCVVNCDRCGLSGVAEENPVHLESVSYAYANGYAKTGAKITDCTNDGCEYNVTEDLAPIFICLGYSTNDDNSGIATGFVVDHESLSIYEEYIGEKLTFGIVVFNPKYLGADEVFTDEGRVNASKGALQVEFDLVYAHCNVSIKGMSLNNEAHAALELVFAGYAYTGDDKGSAQIFQKEYVGSSESPVSSPMVNKVTRGTDVLYTIKLQSVLTPAQITAGKETLGEFTA